VRTAGTPDEEGTVRRNGNSDALPGGDDVQQLLRIRSGQGPAVKERREVQDLTVDRECRRHGQEAHPLRARRSAQGIYAGRSHLPDALRRRLVDGYSVAGYTSGGDHQETGAASVGAVH